MIEAFTPGVPGEAVYFCGLVFRPGSPRDQQSPRPFCRRTPSFSAMGNETVLESVQVFGRKVS